MDTNVGRRHDILWGTYVPAASRFRGRHRRDSFSHARESPLEAHSGAFRWERI